MKTTALLVVLLCLSACQDFEPVLTAPGNAIEASVQRQLFRLSGKNPEPIKVSRWLEEGRESRQVTTQLNGVVYKDLYEDKAMEIMNARSGPLAAQGYYLYMTNLHFDDTYKTLRDLVVVKGYSKYDLLRLYDTSGPNYDISNEQVINQLLRWEKQLTIKMVAIEADRFEALLEARNYDLNRLAQENYTLCPDVIEQGYGSMEELVKGLGEYSYIWCWWD